MTQIRPVSDLRNKFAEISRTARETKEPVILTRKGYGDMVVFSYEAYNKHQYELAVAMKLREAEVESATTNERFTHDQVMRGLRARLKETAVERDV